MNKINKYISKILKNINISYSEKKELKLELIEHLLGYRDEYIKAGLSEVEAIDKAINKFEISNFYEEINRYSQNNKYTTMNLSYFIKLNLILGFSYILFTVLFSVIFNQNLTSNLCYFFIIGITLFINYEITSRKYCEKNTIIKNIFFINISFFLIEKVSIGILAYIYNFVFGIGNIKLSELYIFNIDKILIYIFICIITLVMAKGLDREFKIIPNISLSDFLVLFIGGVLNIVYFLFPNRFYFLNMLISNIFNLKIETFEKNIIYITLNNSIQIFNIGLILLILWIIYKVFSLCYKSQ